MAGQISTDAQAGIIRDKNECRTTLGYTIERAPLRLASDGTAAPVRGDCCALSGLFGILLPATQGRATARKTRGRLPWAHMLRPLRGKSE